ncbi:MAG: aldehyde dehydrogenase, partial [Bacillota bacterium]
MKNISYDRHILRQREYFKTGETRDLKFRLEMLTKLKEGVIQKEENIIAALKKDLRKPPLESYTTEIGVIITEINIALKNLRKWAKDKRVKGNFLVSPSKSYIINEPYGVVLIIGPWNYPFQLSLAPLIGAMAAGNCCIVKPSEMAKASSAAIKKLIEDNFDDRYITVIEGDAEVAGALLEQRFDKIFFTGSPTIGRIVMEKAAKHLTPVTLELGGKNPCLVDRGVDLDITAKRILWGKFINTGQTCIAPDYLLVHREIKDDLYNRLIKWLNIFYGTDHKESSDLGRIINKSHFERLTGYLSAGRIIAGGAFDENELFIAPTILEVSTTDSQIMQEEIFGPILPVVEYEEYEEAEDIINLNPTPLAFYLFSTNRETVKKLTRQIPFGGGTVNDTFSHILNFNLPFGGRGSSGMGNYRGKYSFDAFSHQKSMLIKGFGFDTRMKYPPYKDS